jgi:hypothetical protein
MMSACVVDRHLFNADPEPSFHFGADSDPDPGLTSSSRMLENLIFLTLIHSSAS